VREKSSPSRDTQVRKQAFLSFTLSTFARNFIQIQCITHESVPHPSKAIPATGISCPPLIVMNQALPFFLKGVVADRPYIAAPPHYVPGTLSPFAAFLYAPAFRASLWISYLVLRSTGIGWGPV